MLALKAYVTMMRRVPVNLGISAVIAALVDASARSVTLEQQQGPAPKVRAGGIWPPNESRTLGHCAADNPECLHNV